MNRVEIGCLQYQDLLIIVPAGENIDYRGISQRAREMVRICDKRSMGGECPTLCPMAKVALADPDQVEAAIRAAFSA